MTATAALVHEIFDAMRQVVVYPLGFLIGGCALILVLESNRLGRKINMNHAELLALLAADNAEVKEIGTKVDALVAAIGAASGVPQDVQDAANELKASLDAVDASAVAPPSA